MVIFAQYGTPLSLDKKSASLRWSASSYIVNHVAFVSFAFF
jgi:hypothetical protein